MRHGLRLAGVTLLWLVGLNIGWDCLVPHCIMGSRDPGEFPTFFGPQWQSFCTALMAGRCLSQGDCERVYRNHNWSSVQILVLELLELTVELNYWIGIWNWVDQWLKLKLQMIYSIHQHTCSDFVLPLGLYFSECRDKCLMRQLILVIQ